VPPRGICSRCSSGVAELRTFMCPSLPAGAKVQPQQLRMKDRIGDQIGGSE
jgi:hypothetical protein